MIQQNQEKPPDVLPPSEIPLGQRLVDSPFLLLGAGLIIMFVFYTIWGLIEIQNLPQSSLP